MPRGLRHFVAPDLVESCCTECGALVPDEFASCGELSQSILTDLGSRRNESPAGGSLHRLVADSFGLQHPTRSRESPKQHEIA